MSFASGWSAAPCPSFGVTETHTGIAKLCKGWCGRLSLAFWVLLFAEAPAMCQEAYSVRDSSGVSIVEYGELDAEKVAYVVGRPSYRRGWSDVGLQFGNIVSGVLLSDGSAVVGDGSTGEIVFIAPAGTVTAVVGGAGQGPGELGRITSVTLLPGDTVAVEDDGNNRFSFFFDGEFVDDQRFAYFEMNSRMRALGWEGRDLILATSSMPSPLPEAAFYGSIVRHRYGSSQWDTIAHYRAAERHLPPMPPLRAAGDRAQTEGAVATIWRARSEVVVRSLRNDRTLIVRWIDEPRELTDSLWELHQEYSRARGLRATAWDARARSRVHEIPALGDVRGDDRGQIWVSDFTPDYRHPTRFRIFSRRGAWIGWVEMPDRFQILDIRDEHVLGVQRDEFDVEALVLAPLHAVSRN